MSLTLTGWRLHPVHLPYPRPLRWVAHTESGIDVMVLALETAGGLVGAGEAVARVNWTGATLNTLAVALEDIFLPRLLGQDLLDEAAVAAITAKIPESALAKSLIDIACWDLRAQAAGEPLWRRLGGTSNRLPVSITVTRAEPAVMAADAAHMVERFGFRALKIKTGQGLHIDRAALAAIRAAVGDGVTLFADFNDGCPPDGIGEAARMLADMGVAMVEDPVPLSPDASFGAVKAASPVPVLVDGACRNLAQAKLFLGAGAEAVSVKVPKSGLTESRQIGAAAAAAGARVCIGLGATSSLGAMAALSLAGAMPAATQGLPCEESFFVQLADEYVHMPLRVEDGTVTLPDTPSLAGLVDWRKLEALRA